MTVNEHIQMTDDEHIPQINHSVVVIKLLNDITYYVVFPKIQTGEAIARSLERLIRSINNLYYFKNMFENQYNRNV